MDYYLNRKTQGIKKTILSVYVKSDHQLHHILISHEFMVAITRIGGKGLILQERIDPTPIRNNLDLSENGCSGRQFLLQQSDVFMLSHNIFKVTGL